MNEETYTSKIRLSWDISYLFRLTFKNVASVAPARC